MNTQQNRIDSTDMKELPVEASSKSITFENINHVPKTNISSAVQVGHFICFLYLKSSFTDVKL